jgi:cell division protein FtsA
LFGAVVQAKREGERRRPEGMIMKSPKRLCGAIDLGTTKVAALVAEETNGVLRVVGAGLAPSEGMRQGVVVDIERASACVAKAVADAERMAGAAPRAYNVGAAGEHVRSMNSRGVVTVGSIEKEIAPDDVARAFDAARKFSLPQDREIIHTLPQEFIVDNQRGVRQPAGMFGARLEARVHVVTASRPALDNLAKALQLAGVDPAISCWSRSRRRRRCSPPTNASTVPSSSTSAAARRTSWWSPTAAFWRAE